MTMVMKRSIVPSVLLVVCSLKALCFNSNVVVAFLPDQNNNNSRQCPNPNVPSFFSSENPAANPSSTTKLWMGSREDEIRRKIMKLKKQGKIKKDTTSSSSAVSGEGSSSPGRITITTVKLDLLPLPAALPKPPVAPADNLTK